MPIENTGTPTKEELAAKMKSLVQKHQTIRAEKVAQFKNGGSLQQGANQQAASMKTAAPAVKEEATAIDKKIMGKIANYSKFVAAASAKYGVPASQINAIIATESEGKEKADSGPASGLMQVMRDTWTGTCNHANFPELKKYSDFEKYRYNPEINIMVGTATLVLKAKTFGLKPDHPKFGEIAVAAYNGGEGTIKLAMKNAQAAGKNPATDYLKPEFLKPAIQHYKLYSYYMPKHKGEKSNKSGSVEEAIELKYNEIIKYVPKVKHYLAIQGEATPQNAATEQPAPKKDDAAHTTPDTTKPTTENATANQDGKTADGAESSAAKTISASVGNKGTNEPNDVKLVQQLLNQHGANIKEDGNVGAQTIEAITAFQKKAGLAIIDGRVDVNKNTWNALISGKTTPPASETPATTSGTGTSKDATNSETSDKDGSPTDAPKGDGKTLSAPVGKDCPNTTEDVTLIQTLLNKHGFKVGIDGKFGNETAQAITAFQKKAGLAVQDGVVTPDKNTWKALNGAAVAKPTNDNTHEQSNQHEEAPQGGNYYTHPDYTKVKLVLGSGTPSRHPLNATADKLLRSLLAKAGIMQAHVSSTLRTFAEQAEAMFTNKRGGHNISYANGDAMTALDRYYANHDQAGFAQWIEKNAPTLSNHLSGRAIDVTKINHSAFHKVLKEHLAGFSKYIDERPKGLDVTHIEFTFRVV